MSERVLVEGHNMTVAVNVLSTLLLGLLLLPKLKDVARRYGIIPHLVFVSSIAGFDVQGLWEVIRDSRVTTGLAETSFRTTSPGYFPNPNAKAPSSWR
jgi:hypothetical protein